MSGTVGIAFLAGITVSNFSESAASFLILSQIGHEVTAFVLAVAAGAILAMLAETRISEACKHEDSLFSLQMHWDF